MSTVITTAGEQLIAQKIGAGAVLSIDTIILSHIPDLDVNLPVDREQGKPQPENVVHEYAIPEDFKGYVNPNQVVYSMLLGSEIGNFQFNWLGLYSSTDDVLIAVTHLPVTQKWQTDNASNTLGNNLTRNFMLEFSGAKAVTNITVEAKTWQVDFTARLRSIDERERRSSRDIYGRSCFFNDGFSVVKDGNGYVLKAGAGYVEGIRCVLNSDLVLAVSGLPKNVFIDVSLQQQGSDVVPVITPYFGSSWGDYTDGDNGKHYCIKVAEISAAGAVKDVRRTEAVTSDLVEYLKRRTDNHANRKDDPHSTLAKVKALLTSSVTSISTTMFATPKAVKIAYDKAVEALNTANSKCPVNHHHNTVYYTQSQVRALIAAIVIKPAGHIELLPFRPDALPPHHYMCNGEGVLKTSSAGERLLSMPSTYKTNWGVTENSTHVFLPNVFSGSDGYFFRAVNGSSRRVGNKQNDAIRNITGHMAFRAGQVYENYASGALFASGESLSGATSAATEPREDFSFDASRVVPTAHENRPKNVGMTPTIYLPPL